MGGLLPVYSDCIWLCQVFRVLIFLMAEYIVSSANKFLLCIGNVFHLISIQA